MFLTLLAGACSWDRLTGPESTRILAFAAEAGVVSIHELEVILNLKRYRETS